MRLALGLGDQELEQRLRPALEAADDLQVIAQCLAADQLLQLVSAQALDAAVVAWSLHRLTDALLDQLERPGLVLVLLVADPTEERWRRRPGPVLSTDTDPEVLHQAILSARPGLRRASRPAPPAEPVRRKPDDRRASEPPVGHVIAVAGGAGSPGRTTLAINLATALGSAAPTVLVDLDLCAPAVGAYVDADPSQNVCTLAHAVREDPRAWSAALGDELQPLGSSRSQAVVLCGPPKREMRASVGPALVERLVDELAQRFRWVIVDVGPELLGSDSISASHRAALARAQHVLLVCAAEFIGLWHARTALDQIERLVGIDRRGVHLIVNKHDLRFHHSRQEVEWHLGAPVVAVIPFDHAGLQRAISDQRAVVLDRSSRAGRALLALGERLHEGKLRLPAPTPADTRVRWWQRVFRRPARVGVPPRMVPVDEPRAAPVGVGGRRSRGW